MFRYSWFGSLVLDLTDLVWEIVKNILMGIAFLLYIMVVGLADAAKALSKSHPINDLKADLSAFHRQPRFDKIMYCLMVANLGSLLAIVKISGSLDLQYQSAGNIAWFGSSMAAIFVLPAILIIRQSKNNRRQCSCDAEGNN